jgi:hypothetical protein
MVFLENIVVNIRCFALFISFMRMEFIGDTNIFTIYYSKIKMDLSYDQPMLYILGSFKDMGAKVEIIFGLLGGGESVVTVLKQLYPFLNSLQNTQ